MGETSVLGQFAAEFPSHQIPADVVHASERCVLDYFGVGLAALDEPTVVIARELSLELGGADQATMLGGARSSVTNVALVNGIAAHVLDFDDTHEPTILHGYAPVLSAALAIADWRDATGADLVAAHCIGFEVAARAALAVHPEHYDQGFHVTGTAGTLGAAAAAGRLLGLNAEQMANALSAAAAQAAGLREMFGSMSKSLHVGKAASNGVYSALLAERGWVSSATGLEGVRGYWSVLSSRMDPAQAVDRLGETWELRNDGFKPYACGVVTHPTIDAAAHLGQAADVPVEQIQEILCRVNPYVLELCGKREPATGLEGKFSIYHCAAAGYVDSTARPRQFSDEAVARPDLVALRRKVRAEVDPALPTSAAEVTVTARDGRSWHKLVESATGTPGNPMSDEALRDKFADLVFEQLGDSATSRLADLTLSAAQLPTVRELFRASQ